MTKEPTIIKMPTFPNDDWTQVEIFLRAYGRLPNQEGDRITQDTLDRFCKNYENGYAQSKVTPLQPIYEAIQRGEVKLTN